MSHRHDIEWLHQILIVDDMKLPSIMPEAIQKNMDFAKEVYPYAHHKMWGGEELREFIRREFGMEVLVAFDVMTPYSYKCDLARFCLLWFYGGIYCDLAIRLLNPWDIPSRCGVAAFSEMYPGMESWTLTQTSLLWSVPHRKEWQYAIEGVVANCRDHFYGPHDHYPTAGALLGRCFARVMAEKGQRHEADDQFMGEVRYITPERRPQNVTYVSPEHKSIIGLRTKKVSGEISEFNLGGTNNYIEIWEKKKVYGERVRNWRIDDPRIVVEERAHQTLTGAMVHGGTSGRVLYGPFLTLDPGEYKIIVYFSHGTRFDRFFMDVTSGYGSEVLGDCLISSGKIIDHDRVEFFFSTKECKNNVEFRVSVFEGFVGEIRKISLVEKVLHLEASDRNFYLEENVKKIEGKIVFEKSEGAILSSPFISLERGKYLLTVLFEDRPESMSANLKINYDIENNTLIEKEIELNYFDGNKYTFEFDVLDNLKNVSFRLSAVGESKGALRSISIEEIWNEDIKPKPVEGKKSYLSVQSDLLTNVAEGNKFTDAIKIIKRLIVK